MTNSHKTYYHGTFPRHAYSIMTQGFRVGEESHGRSLGHGLYVAEKLETAALMGHGIVITCKISPGSRILWLDDDYDRKVISYLKKEFGRELLEQGPQFHKAIPKNKQLMKSELIQLCKYIYNTREKYFVKGMRAKGKKSKFFDAWWQLARLNEHIKRHNFDAVGDRSGKYWDSDEIMFFNPSKVTPIDAIPVDVRWESMESVKVACSGPIPLDELKRISEKKQKEWEDFLAEFGDHDVPS